MITILVVFRRILSSLFGLNKQIMKIKTIKIVDQTEDTISPSKDSTSRLHLINCQFHKDCQNVPIFDYFDSQFNTNDERLNVSFRGRPMNGQLVQLSKNFSFAVIDPIEGEKNDNTVVARRLVDEAYCWNMDKIPSSNDSMPQILNWINLAKDIHSHVQLEDDA